MAVAGHPNDLPLAHQPRRAVHAESLPESASSARGVNIGASIRFLATANESRAGLYLSILYGRLRPCNTFVDYGYMGLIFRHGGRQCVAYRKKARARGSHTQNYVVLQAVGSEQDIES